MNARSLVGLVMIGLAVMGCQAEVASPTATSTIELSATNTPTATVNPTATNTPTAILTPTATLFPSPTPFTEQRLMGELPEDALVRLGRGWIRSFLLSPDGDLFVVGSSIGVFCYDADSFEEQWFYPTSGRTRLVSWDEDEIVVKMLDGKYITLSIDGKLIREMHNETSATGNEREYLSPNGKMLLAQINWQWQITDSATGEILWVPEYQYNWFTWSWSPDSSMLQYVDVFYEMHILDTNTWQSMIPDQCSCTHDFEWSPDGSLLACATTGLDIPLPSEVCLWNAQNGRLLHHWEFDNNAWTPVFSPNGKRIYIQTTNNVYMWDIESGELLNSLEGFLGYWQSPRALAWSPDGSMLGVGHASGGVTMIDTESYEQIASLSQTDFVGFTYMEVDSVAFATDPSVFLVENRHSITRWIVMWYQDGRVEELKNLFGIYLTLSPDGSQFITYDVFYNEETDRYRAILTLYDIETQEKIWEYRSGDMIYGNYWGPYWTMGGSYVMLQLQNETVIIDTQDGTDMRYLDVDSGDYGLCAVSPDGKLMALCGQSKTQLQETETGEVVYEWSNSSNHVAFSPDSTLVAIGFESGSATLFDVESYNPILTYAGHNSPITDMLFSPDSAVLALAHEDGMITLVDTEDGAQIRTFTGHNAEIISWAFSPDGSELASASEDGTIIIWDVAN